MGRTSPGHQGSDWLRMYERRSLCWCHLAVSLVARKFAKLWHRAACKSTIERPPIYKVKAKLWPNGLAELTGWLVGWCGT